MRYLLKITALSAALLLSACQELPDYLVGDNTVARVGRKELRMSELEHVVPQALGSADSADFVSMYIDKWIAKQLKLEEAELIFSESESDIEAKVEEYRQSLLIRKIEQYYLDTEAVPDVTDADIEAYYNAHKADFRLDKTIVKGRIVSFSSKYRQRDRLFEMMKSQKASTQKEFKDICVKNNFNLHEFTEWSDFTDFLAQLPTLRSRNYDSMLTDSNVHKMESDGITYYYQITAVRNKGEVRPLEMASETIRRVLKTHRQGEAIKAHEEMITRQALKNGHARIYTKEENSSAN